MSLIDDIKALAGEVKAPFTGMKITQGYSQKDRVTIQYPEVRRPDAAARALASCPEPL